jgi:hypothetical protein
MERKIKMITGCKTNGWTDLEIGNICSDPECPSCGMFHKLLEEEAKKFMTLDEAFRENNKYEEIEEIEEKFNLEKLDKWIKEIYNERNDRTRKKN